MPLLPTSRYGRPTHRPHLTPVSPWLAEGAGRGPRRAVPEPRSGAAGRHVVQGPVGRQQQLALGPIREPHVQGQREGRRQVRPPPYPSSRSHATWHPTPPHHTTPRLTCLAFPPREELLSQRRSIKTVDMEDPSLPVVVHRCLGKGAAGRVYECRLGGFLCAVKVGGWVPCVNCRPRAFSPLPMRTHTPKPLQLNHNLAPPPPFRCFAYGSPRIVIFRTSFKSWRYCARSTTPTSSR
jgi:hypothetical protein